MQHPVLATVVTQSQKHFTNKAFSSTSIQDLIPTLAGMFCIAIILYQPKLGLNLADLLENALFVHAFGFDLQQ